MAVNKDNPSILKSTRQAKGLTLEIVHEATKIPMDSLKAIEEGYSSRILSPFYYRGFIKIYAEFLGLDVAEMYTHYGLDQPAPKPAAVTTAPKSNLKENQPSIFVEQMQELGSVVFKPKTFKLILKIIGFLVLFVLLFKMVGYMASHMNKKTGAPKRQVAVEKTVAVYPVIKHDSVQAQSQTDKVEVAVRAIKDTWLQVKADGNVVFETTLAKGSMESWSASSRIELSGRNIERLDMEVNGKHIGSLGGGERRIRRVIITHEGLTVKK